ncbi:MAG: prolyl oligopeptidase family serine peptidase, partial [Planctomycetota bacterium]
MALVSLRRRFTRCVAALLAALASPFASTAWAGTGLDLSSLFLPPTATELDAVRADWATRPLVVEGFRLEATGLDSQGALFHVLSHIVEGQRHFGAIRFPRNYTPGTPYGALVVCHGGLQGVGIEEASNFLTVLPGQCVDDEYFLIIPSFRGEGLGTSFAGVFNSGGTPSWADRDVDDTRALLSTVLANYPDVDDARIGAWGISRGGAVALLLTARDDRIRRVVDMFGFTDLSLPSVLAEVDKILNANATPAGIGRVVFESVVNPYLTGAITLDEARLAWIRRSPCYFATDIPAVQAHHGLLDLQVDPSHTMVLVDAMLSAGFSPADVQAFYYPSGTHGLNSLQDHGDRVEPFLCALNFGPRGYCGPMSPTADGRFAAADYRGSASTSTNDFVFRVNNGPSQSVGIAFVSDVPAYAPSGAGFLCLGLGAQRLGVAGLDASGTFELSVDLTTTLPNIAPYFDVGSNAYFQLVFRDVGNPAGAWNFSNGL